MGDHWEVLLYFDFYNLHFSALCKNVHSWQPLHLRTERSTISTTIQELFWFDQWIFRAQRRWSQYNTETKWMYQKTDVKKVVLIYSKVILRVHLEKAEYSSKP